MTQAVALRGDDFYP